MGTDDLDLHASEIIHELPANTPVRFLANGSFLFAAYGCALTGRQTTGGTNVYTAVNLSNGKSVILSRRKGKLAEDGFTVMAARIGALDIRGDSRFCIDKRPDERPDHNRLIDTARRLFTEILPLYGYTFREKQLELAEHILGVTGRRGVSLAESEVGTGKTHAYLAAAVLAKRGRLNDFWLRGHYPEQSWAESAYMPVVISTSSIALQKAIVTDYIPELSRILLRHGIIRAPLTAAVRKGKSHYICEKRFKRFYEGSDSRTRALLAPYDGPRSPFDLTSADSLTPHMKRSVCVTGGRCAGHCALAEGCRYLAHQRRVNDPKIDFQITNHNYFLADVLRRAEGKPPLLPHYQMVIIDEAHKFLSAARSMYGTEFSAAELPEIAREIHAFTAPGKSGGVNVNRLAKNLGEQSAKLFRRLNDNIPEPEEDDDAERFPAVFDGETMRHLGNIANAAAKIAEACTNGRTAPVYRERKAAALWRLEDTAERAAAFQNPGDHICWLETGEQAKTGAADILCATPKDLDERLYRDLWSKGVPIILTSGTLSASGDFSRIKRTLGLDRLPERLLTDVSMPSPFDHRRNSLLYISKNVPFPDYKDKRYIPAVADEVERLVMASHGHAAVLFTSYNAMGQVYALLKNRSLPFPLFRLERGGTGAIERFKKSGGGILLASGAMWEGIDIPGDALSMLIIVKLPFPVPDPIGDYERSLCGSMETFKRRVIIPDTQIKLRQGHGRGIRSETDTCAVAILDIRMAEGWPYHRVMLAALPECEVTSDMAVVEAFYREKKQPAYFSEGGLNIYDEQGRI